MKIPDPISIDLLEFFKTGKFDYLKLGQTKEWIINNFPDPDEMSKACYKHPIWRYGNVELHFNDDQTLFLIYSDYIDTLDGGKSLQLNKWILEEPEKLTLEYIIHHLNKERINFKLEHKPYIGEFELPRIELLESKVLLSFAPDELDFEDTDEYLIRSKIEDSNTFKLVSFSLTSLKY